MAQLLADLIIFFPLFSMLQTLFYSCRLEAAWWGALQEAAHAQAAPTHLPMPPSPPL